MDPTVLESLPEETRKVVEGNFAAALQKHLRDIRITPRQGEATVEEERAHAQGGTPNSSAVPPSSQPAP